MKDQVVLISGGTKGIGYATAEKYLREGNTVVIGGRNEKDGAAAAERLSALGEVLYVRCDAAEEADCKAIVEKMLEKYGRVDILVNVAGVVGKRNSFLENDNADTLNTLKINVMGTIYLASLAAKSMVERKRGVIINVGSLCGFIANTESIGYHASKGAVRMATQVMARDLAPHGVRVLSVAPGWVRTGMLLADIKAHGASLHMKNRVIEPEEIANAIYLLSLPEASAINGTTVMTDDGYTSFKY